MTLTESPNEYKLEDGPSDGITAVKFAPNSNQYLLVSSWDQTVRLYDLSKNSLRTKYEHSMPVLDCCLQDETRAWSVGVNKEVTSCDLITGTKIVHGLHDAPIRCVEFSTECNVVISGSWDCTVKLWDPRSPSGPTSTHTQPDKVYTMALCGDKLLVGTAQRKVMVWDLRNMSYVQQRRESSLKYQTRCIRCFPNRQGFVLSSIEGRVAVEYLDPSPEAQKKKYAFKCHRVKDPASRMEMIYPVNAIAFHNQYNTFATGGSDGFVNIWDGFNKKRLCQFHKYPTSISSLAFSPDGCTLAIASSYLYEQDDVKEIPPDAVFIRRVTDQETKPK